MFVVLSHLHLVHDVVAVVAVFYLRTIKPAIAPPADAPDVADAAAHVDIYACVVNAYEHEHENERANEDEHEYGHGHGFEYGCEYVDGCHAS